MVAAAAIVRRRRKTKAFSVRSTRRNDPAHIPRGSARIRKSKTLPRRKPEACQIVAGGRSPWRRPPDRRSKSPLDPAGVADLSLRAPSVQRRLELWKEQLPLTTRPRRPLPTGSPPPPAPSRSDDPLVRAASAHGTASPLGTETPVKAESRVFNPHGTRINTASREGSKRCKTRRLYSGALLAHG